MSTPKALLRQGMILHVGWPKFQRRLVIRQIRYPMCVQDQGGCFALIQNHNPVQILHLKYY